METRNAIISDTMLGLEGHGIPTCSIGTDSEGSYQSFGGYDLRYWGYRFIDRILETVGARTWEDLRGKHLRVRADHCKIHAIGHIIEDRWFCPEDEKDEAS